MKFLFLLLLLLCSAGGSLGHGLFSPVNIPNDVHAYESNCSFASYLFESDIPELIKQNIGFFTCVAWATSYLSDNYTLKNTLAPPDNKPSVLRYGFFGIGHEWCCEDIPEDRNEIRAKCCDDHCWKPERENEPNKCRINCNVFHNGWVLDDLDCLVKILTDPSIEYLDDHLPAGMQCCDPELQQWFTTIEDCNVPFDRETYCEHKNLPKICHRYKFVQDFMREYYPRQYKDEKADLDFDDDERERKKAIVEANMDKLLEELRNHPGQLLDFYIWRGEFRQILDPDHDESDYEDAYLPEDRTSDLGDYEGTEDDDNAIRMRTNHADNFPVISDHYLDQAPESGYDDLGRFMGKREAGDSPTKHPIAGDDMGRFMEKREARDQEDLHYPAFRYPPPPLEDPNVQRVGSMEKLKYDYGSAWDNFWSWFLWGESDEEPKKPKKEKKGPRVTRAAKKKKTYWDRARAQSNSSDTRGYERITRSADGEGEWTYWPWKATNNDTTPYERMVRSAEEDEDEEAGETNQAGQTPSQRIESNSRLVGDTNNDDMWTRSSSREQRSLADDSGSEDPREAKDGCVEATEAATE